jgi:prolipoprotein diacylglyceryltransferase
VVLLWFQRRKAYDGQVFLLYLCLQGGGQFGLEFFRFTPLPHVQYLSLLFLIVGGSLLLMKARFVRAGATESLSPPLRKG